MSLYKNNAFNYYEDNEVLPQSIHEKRDSHLRFAKKRTYQSVVGVLAVIGNGVGVANEELPTGLRVAFGAFALIAAIGAADNNKQAAQHRMIAANLATLIEDGSINRHNSYKVL